jgi:hypothetical protein
MDRGCGCATPEPHYHPRRPTASAFRVIASANFEVDRCPPPVVVRLHFLRRSTTIPLGQMTNTSPLRCDGCGQSASAKHIARRLDRLEWATRYRPVHIGTLFLGAIAAESDAEFLYAENGQFAGQAGILLEASGLSSVGKSAEATLAEFQRGGFFLAHVLECPLERGTNDIAAARELLDQRLPAALARIRRSWKPKKLVPISQLLEPLIGSLAHVDLGCSIVLDGRKPFALDGNAADVAITCLREALSVVSTSGRADQ